MNCVEKGCSGFVDSNRPFTVLTTRTRSEDFFPCNICGRLHWKNGSGAMNGFGNSTFLIDGKVHARQEKENEIA